MIKPDDIAVMQLIVHVKGGSPVSLLVYDEIKSLCAWML